MVPLYFPDDYEMVLNGLQMVLFPYGFRMVSSRFLMASFISHELFMFPKSFPWLRNGFPMILLWFPDVAGVPFLGLAMAVKDEASETTKKVQN